MNIRAILEQTLQHRASDLLLKAGTAPTIRIDGELRPLDEPEPSNQDLDGIVEHILTPKQKKIFYENNEIDFAFSIPGVSRFRANFFHQRGTVAMAFRQIPFGVPNMDQLNLPEVLADLTLKPRGLVLVTGTVGQGKSTTLASMIDNVNNTKARNIITVEDPIEFLHRDNLSLISQREVGLDTGTFHSGLKHILRQDPDIILIGEIREQETMRVALMAADTGHLVLSTLHTPGAAQTINRLLSFFPPHEHDEVRYLLAANLTAIVSLRLIPHKSGQGRVPAVEILINTPTISDYLLDPEKTPLIHKAMSEGVSQYGMQTFDQALMRLYSEDQIDYDQALKNCSNPAEFDLRARGIQSASDGTWDEFEAEAS